MNKIFRVELSSGNGRYFELDLPATDYELLDALDRIQMEPGEKPVWEILEHTQFQYLHVFLNEQCSLYELNTLSRKLGSMDHGQLTAFDGLFKMSLGRRDGPMSITDLFTYANSTECCHVVDEVFNDAQLGRFYAENGFVPELEHLPDSVFEKLDFASIGKEMREADKGVFTKYGYVLQNDNLKPVTESMDVVPKTPEYAFRLLIGRYPFETNDQSDKLVQLELPATEGKLNRALEECGAASWSEVTFQAEDSAIPGLLENMDCNSIPQINKLAQAIKYQEGQDELPKLKAILHAADCHDINTAIEISENLDNYFYEDHLRTYEEVAREELLVILDRHDLSILEKHIDLFNYGRDLIASCHATMTPYGLVDRKGSEMILSENETLGYQEMEMQL